MARIGGGETSGLDVIRAYLSVLGREPESDEIVHFWTSQRRDIHWLYDRLVHSEEAQRRFQSTQRLLFAHAPKTGGSSIRDGLIEMYGRDNIFWVGIDDAPSPWHLRTGHMVDDYPVVGGHLSAHQLAERCVGASLFATSVREPIARAVSLFRYLTSEDVAHNLKPELLALGFERALWESETFISELENYQCYVIAGERNYSSAMRRISHANWIVETVDRIDILLFRIAQIFSLPAVGQAPRVNVGLHREVPVNISEAAMSRLHQLTADDARLYNAFDL